jgi:hypothetical protein
VLAAARVPVQPSAIGTSWDAVEAAVLALPAYARDVVPWHTIVSEIAESDGEAGLRDRLRAARAFVEALD